MGGEGGIFCNIHAPLQGVREEGKAIPRVNVHLSHAHQRPEHSHSTYEPKYDILYTCRAQSSQKQLTVLVPNTRKVQNERLFIKSQTHSLHIFWVTSFAKLQNEITSLCPNK